MEILSNWTALILSIAGFLAAINYLIKTLKDFKGNIPRGLTKYVTNVLTLVVPITVIIWGGFYLSGLYSNRLSEPTFFWAMVSQVVMGVSAYVYLWVSWIYPKLGNIFIKPEQAKPTDQGGMSSNHPPERSLQERKTKSRSTKASNKSIRGGTK